MEQMEKKNGQPLLEVENLHVSFFTPAGEVKAVLDPKGVLNPGRMRAGL